jgi:ubiquinone biosynthesis protein
MKIMDFNKHSKQGKRLWEIIRILRRYRIGDWFKGIPVLDMPEMMRSPEIQEMRDRPVAERLRFAMTEMGTTFIKLGQILSTRADLVGPEAAAELCKLQADTPADPPEVVQQTIKDELGEAPEALFSLFEPEAFSSASIGQVHRATLKDGQEVVVKIQHDGIQEKVRLDMDILMELSRLLQEYVPEARAYQPVATANEFRRTLLRELDYTSERRNMEHFARNFKDDSTVHIPGIYHDFCSRRVLTMELLQGVSGSKPDEIQSSGVHLEEFAKTAATVFLNMILRDGFYHADPHPGNFILLEDGVLGLIDCGMVGRIDEYTRELFEDLLLFMLQKDSEGLADLLLRAGSAPANVDRVAFRTDIGDLLLEFGTQELDELDLGGALEQITGIVRRHHILMPSSMSLLLKTLVMLEGTSRMLNPSFSLVELLEPFKDQLIRQRMDPRRWMRWLQRSARDIDRLARKGPRHLADILEGLQSGRLKIKHEHERLEEIADRLVVGILTASLFLGSSMLMSQRFPPLVSGISVIGASGYVFAVVVMGRLLWSQMRRRRHL